MGSRMAGILAKCMETPGDPGSGTGASSESSSGTGPRDVAVEQSCVVSVAGTQEGVAARRVRIPIPAVTLSDMGGRENARGAADRYPLEGKALVFCWPPITGASVCSCRALTLLSSAALAGNNRQGCRGHQRRLLVVEHLPLPAPVALRAGPGAGGNTGEGVICRMQSGAAGPVPSGQRRPARRRSAAPGAHLRNVNGPGGMFIGC
jgi:hypothetical protein